MLLYHAGLGFTGGYVGVDVFFVISGFLITALISEELSLNQFELREFWGRRIRRILPASTMMCLLVLIAGMFLLLPTDFNELAESASAHQLLFSNVFFWRRLSYFAGPSEVKPLLHTWSLAVEEQFYLFYPVLLIILRNVSRTRHLIILTSLFFLSLILSEWAVWHHPSAAFFLLPTRMWELLAGGIAFFCPISNRKKIWQEVGAWMGIALILMAGVLFDSDTEFPGFWALLPCGGSFLLIYCNGTSLTSVGRLLSFRPVVFTGLLSYSLYLWHWPILAYMHYCLVVISRSSKRLGRPLELNDSHFVMALC